MATKAGVIGQVPFTIDSTSVDLGCDDTDRNETNNSGQACDLQDEGNQRCLKKGPIFICETCNVPVPATQYKEHAEGMRHKKKLNQSTSDNTNPANGAVGVSETEEFRCIACDLLCCSKDQLASHMNGKKHAKRCRQKAATYVEALKPKSPAEVEFTGSVLGKLSKKRKKPFRQNTCELLEEDIKRVKELEFSLITDFPTPFEPPYCYEKEEMNESGDFEFQPKRVADGGEPNRKRRLCVHDNCLLIRALKHYVSALEKIECADSHKNGPPAEESS
ncbi:unnamed protein product [Calicophoron daubneyi]|uniref:U1-type domain-containing protein n=1 Tax=Calicophoron daubneyi TaxID=300641 RepID=A0AAV2TAQ4_CALDB